MNEHEKIGNKESISRNDTNILKGIAILLVMFCHFWALYGGKFNRLATPLGGIGVSLFLMLSGYGLRISWRKHGISYWWRKRIIAVLIPYVISRIIAYWLWNPLNIKSFLYDITLLQPGYMHGWYMQYLLWWYVAFYFSSRIASDKSRFLYGLLAIFSLFLFLTTVSLKAEQSISFLAGVVLADCLSIDKLKQMNYKIIILLFIISFVFLLIKQINYIRNSPPLLFKFVELIIKISSGGGICLAVLKFNILGPIFLKALKWIGLISYELYLIHGYILVRTQRNVLGIVVFCFLSFALAWCFHFLLNNSMPVIKKLMAIN